MRKIEINLYPYKEAEEKGFPRFVERYFPIVFLLVVALFLINSGLSFYTKVSSRPLQDLTKKRESLVKEVRAIEDMQKSIDALKKQSKEYENVAGKRVELSQVMAELFAALPKNIWFNRLDLAPDSVEILGFVLLWQEDYMASVDRFFKGLKKSRYFSQHYGKGIELKNSRKTNIGPREVMRFEAACK